MPQVGYGVHPEAIIFRRMALLDFDHGPNFF
jgi:hypothetical protein